MGAKEIARGILEREEDLGFRRKVLSGPADSSIFSEYEPGTSYAGEMEKVGVSWERADKSPGSRKKGWEKLRQMLVGALPCRGYREEPGLFVTERCDQFIRTIPTLPRDDRDLDDVHSDSEDHIGDEVRYRIRAVGNVVGSGTHVGMT